MIAKPTIANVSVTLADTEYSYSLPDGTRRFSVKLRDVGAELKIAFEASDSSTTYVMLPSGRSYNELNVKGGGNTLYFQSPTAGQVAEVLSWK